MDPWTKIMRAYESGRSLQLTAEDVELLGGDSAIETRSCYLLEEQCIAGGHRIKRGKPTCYCGERVKKGEAATPEPRSNVVIRLD